MTPPPCSAPLFVGPQDGGQGTRPAPEVGRERQHPAQPQAHPAGRADRHQHPEGASPPASAPASAQSPLPAAPPGSRGGREAPAPTLCWAGGIAPSLVAVPAAPAGALELPSSFPGSWRSCQAARRSRWCQQPEPSPLCPFSQPLPRMHFPPVPGDSPRLCVTPAAAFAPEDILLLVVLPLPVSALLCAGAGVPRRAWGAWGPPQPREPCRSLLTEASRDGSGS